METPEADARHRFSPSPRNPHSTNQPTWTAHAGATNPAALQRLLARTRKEVAPDVAEIACEVCL